ncbi:MAG: glycosyltransferase family protein [Myxococcota bacterium]
MRIAYGVHGYSRGHATRAASILSELTPRHDVRIYAGGDAYAALSEDFDVEAIPTLGFSYDQSGRMSKWETFKRNFPKLKDLFLRGPDFARVARSMKRYRPDVVISDAEAWTHRAALALGIPRIGFDHFGVMVYCRVPMPIGDRFKSFFDRTAYRTLMGAPERVLVSSFYSARPNSLDVRLVGPLVGDDVAALEPINDGHLLVYLNMGKGQMTSKLAGVLEGCGRPVRAYGPGLTECSVGPAVRLFEPSRASFLQDLANCHAVLSTAGNQLVGEALYLGKPLLVMPEATVEQRLNAGAVARMGIGEVTSFETLSTVQLRAFCQRREAYADACRRHASNGRRAAIERLEAWFEELSTRGALPAPQA